MQVRASHLRVRHELSRASWGCTRRRPALSSLRACARKMPVEVDTDVTRRESPVRRAPARSFSLHRVQMEATMLFSPRSRISTRSILAMFGSAALLALATPLASQPAAPPGSLSSTRFNRVDETTLRDLARGNLAEVAAGKLALEKAHDAEVKAFAQAMVDDHSAAMKDLDQLALSKSVRLPTQPTGAQKAMLKGMESLRPGSFDKQYVSQSGVTDHRKTLALLKRIQAKGKDTELKALAGKMQSTVEQHLEHAVKLASK